MKSVRTMQCKICTVERCESMHRFKTDRNKVIINNSERLEHANVGVDSISSPVGKTRTRHWGSVLRGKKSPLPENQSKNVVKVRGSAVLQPLQQHLRAVARAQLTWWGCQSHLNRRPLKERRFLKLTQMYQDCPIVARQPIPRISSYINSRLITNV